MGTNWACDERIVDLRLVVSKTIALRASQDGDSVSWTASGSAITLEGEPSSAVSWVAQGEIPARAENMAQKYKNEGGRDEAQFVKAAWGEGG